MAARRRSSLDQAADGSVRSLASDRIGVTVLETSDVPLPTDPRPTPLTPELVEQLMQAAQSGFSDRAAELCGAWLRTAPTPDDVERFKLLSILFVCAQTDRSDLDEDDIVRRMIDAAERSGSRSSLATAHASRALTLATRGQCALAIPDLSRATTLLEESGPELAVAFPAIYLRRQACNTLALALTRIGIHDHALRWLDEFRATGAPFAARSPEQFLATFNEAWIQLTLAIDLDLDPDADTGESRTCYRAAAETFRRAAADRGTAGTRRMVASAENLAAAAAVLGGDRGPVAALRTVVDTAQSARPDHRAIFQLAVAHADARSGDLDGVLGRIDDALTALPPDHSFRSIAIRLRSERVAISVRSVPHTPERSSHQQLAEVLLHDRRDERRTYRIAYEDGLAAERQRLALLAESALAQVDELTGLSARPVLADSLARALQHVTQPGRRGVVAFVDLDGFKGVNDTRSHQAGDLVLQLFGRQVRDILRANDAAVRYGGDEFVLILLDRSVEDARTELLGLRGELGRLTAAHAEISVPVTFSAGIVDVAVELTQAELLRSADLAMFSGKRSGGDTIAIGPALRGNA